MFNNKKRIIAIAIILCLAVIVTFAGIQMNDSIAQQKRQELYDQAVEQLRNQPLKLDGTNETTEALATAITNAPYTQPKNIILMIGDGMGFNAAQGAQRVYSDKLFNGTLAMNMLPVKGAQSTYSVSSDVTDSAAGATALATGCKTANKVVAMDYMSTKNYTTVLELAAAKGMATGVVTTRDIVH